MEATIPGQDMIPYIKCMIRYDIPILMVGSSSIGKSFTIIELAKTFRIPNEILYVGSEKADNIEGLPKLTGLSSDDDKLKYLKPFWFPKGEKITRSVKHGKEIFDAINSQIYGGSFPFTYNSVEELLNKVCEVKYANPASTTTEININRRRYQFERKVGAAMDYDDDLQDLSLFLCTLIGYGNYWLILDELDKVQEIDADKYAPMLHIVRERTLKGYHMREFNDGEGADVAINVKGDDYKVIYNKIAESISANLSLVDTRVISVANQSENINEISEALFRRFVQILVDSILILKPVPDDIGFVANCLKENYKSVTPTDVPFALLDRENLQWLYGFIPRIANRGDSGNWIRDNFLLGLEKSGLTIEGLSAESAAEAVYSAARGTALYKMMSDNFEEENLKKQMLYCIYLRLAGETSQKKNNQFFEGGIANSALRDIGEKKNLGFDSKMIADDIEQLWYTELRNLVIKTDRSRVYEIETLIRKAFEYVRSSAGIESSISVELLKENSYPDLITYLIPKFIRFAYTAFVPDDTISADDVIVLYQSTHYLLEDLGKRLNKSDISFISDYVTKSAEGAGQGIRVLCNINETKALFYGSENSFFGPKGERSYFLASDFMQGLIYRFYSRTSFSFRKDYIEAVLTKEKQPDRFHALICNFMVIENYTELKSYFQERAVALLKSKNATAAKKYLDLKKAWADFSEPLRKSLNLPL